MVLEKEFGFREIAIQIPTLHSPTTGCCIFVIFVAFSFFLPTAWCWKASGLHFLTFSFHLHSLHRCSHPVPTDDLYLTHQPLLWTPDWYIQHLLNITALMSNRGKLHTPTTSLLMAGHTPSMLLPQSSASLLLSISFHLWRNPPCHLRHLLSQVSFKFGSMFEICVWTSITSSSPSWLKPQHLSPGLVQQPPHCSPYFRPCPPYRLFSTKQRTWFFGHA